MSQLFAGIYILEIALMGLFFLVRDSQDRMACSSQFIIMIVVLILTAIFHFVMEQHLRPLYEFLPVTLEDKAVDAEHRLSLLQSDGGETSARFVTTGVEGVSTAANARSNLFRLKNQVAAKVSHIQAHLPEPIDKSRRRQVADQLGAAIAGYPDELTDLDVEEREAELRAAFQDP
ncbi:MAG: hypothetical protein Q9164_007980, partial [Protoblastenia rupestris]